MKSALRKLIPQKIINLFEHLPMAVLFNILYGFPARRVKVIGVTGTDGKTTTVNMIYRILKEAGKKVSMVSTINASIGGKDYDTGFHVTSPSPKMVQNLIKRATQAGDEYIVLEVTSHSLDQYRFWGIKFDIGVITNITHEHLDYHKSFENYRRTKAKLIEEVRFAVLNLDDPNFEYLSKKTYGKVLSFGFSKRSDFNPGRLNLKLKIPGDYNILNALAASAVAETLGINKNVVEKSLNNFSNLSGRMEEVKNDLGIKIYIDFAHTPNGLESALKALNEMKGKGKIISLIGAEGLRDVGKRPMMGEVATNLSDIVIITSVDPRGLIDQINEQILVGVEMAGGKVGENIFVINDRQKAIDVAIRELAKKGDVVGIFGKGHETSMNLDGKVELPWSDKGSVQKTLDG